jgi:K+/H+ antiporter YhaU regulatory subunit KhtT
MTMIAIITLLVVLTVSILIVRVAAVALTHTGLSRQVASFQALSAFSGSGFTTGESEKVVNHPVRRGIIKILMRLGNAGIVTSIATLIVTFINLQTSTHLVLSLAILLGGLIVLWFFARSKWVDRHLSNLISRALRRFTNLDVHDYSSLLHLAGEYRVAEMRVEPDGWLAGKTLIELDLLGEGIMVMGITRPDGGYVGTPRGLTRIQANDNLIVYGRASTFQKLDQKQRSSPTVAEQKTPAQDRAAR